MVEEIAIDIKFFNPLYFHLLKYMKDEKVRRILVYGSSSAAKTYSISQALVFDGCLDRKYNSLVFRKEGSNIKDTLRNDLREIILNMLQEPPLPELFEVYDFEFRCLLGTYIRLRGLDTSGKIKGMKGYRKVYLDEIDQFYFDDWKEINRRLRGDINQQILASWNPVSETHWIKKVIDKYEWVDEPRIVDDNPYSELSENSFVRRSTDGRNILIKTVYQDNKWVVGGKVGDQNYGEVDTQALADFEEMKNMYPYDYWVYGLGEWGIIRPETPYFHNYKDEIHYSKQRFPFDPFAETWLSFDFNYDPTTCTVFQIWDTGVVALRCYKKKGGTRELCRLMKLDDELMSVDMIRWTITGDSSGQQRSSTAGDVTDYDIIREEFGIGDQFLRVNSRNKAHAYSRRLCDTFLYKVPFVLSEGTEDLRNDFNKAMPVPGSEQLLKDRSKGLDMDIIDNFRYFVDAKFPGGIDDIKRFSNMLKINQK